MSEHSKHKPTGHVVGGRIEAKASPAHASNITPLVEDTSVVGGVDEESGAPVIRPRTPGGRADESTCATDPREGHG